MVVSQLFVEVIICGLDFPMVAMGEPDPCREPLPRESRYWNGICYDDSGKGTRASRSGLLYLRVRFTHKCRRPVNE